MKLRHPSHASIIIHDFTDDACWIKTGQFRQIHRCLRMARPHQHATFPIAEWKDMARPR